MSKVYSAIAAVQGELAQHGIGKESENTFDRYKFRGIDAVYNALSPLLAKHGLCVLPRIIDRDCQERTSRKGEPMFYVTVTAEFDFVAAEDGSKHTVRTYGEAMDRSDKATNKAMSAAYKYAAFMAFAIPTEGDNDADASTPEVTPANDYQSLKPPRRPPPRTKLGGPAESVSQLETAVRRMDVRIREFVDLDEFELWLKDPKVSPYIEQCKRDHPDWYHGWNGQPDGFTPLGDLIDQRRRELAEKSPADFDSIPDFIHEQAAVVGGAG